VNQEPRVTNIKGYPEREQRLIARGILKPPLKKRRKRDPLPKPVGNVSREVMDQVWREEREGR